MSKTGLAVLNICIGLVIGLLLGYAFFHQADSESHSARAGSPADTDQTAAPDSQQYFYHLNDSTISRHTVGGTGDALFHRVETLKVQPRPMP